MSAHSAPEAIDSQRLGWRRVKAAFDGNELSSDGRGLDENAMVADPAVRATVEAVLSALDEPRNRA